MKWCGVTISQPEVGARAAYTGSETRNGIAVRNLFEIGGYPHAALPQRNGAGISTATGRLILPGPSPRDARSFGNGIVWGLLRGIHPGRTNLVCAKAKDKIQIKAPWRRPLSAGRRRSSGSTNKRALEPGYCALSIRYDPGCSNRALELNPRRPCESSALLFQVCEKTGRCLTTAKSCLAWRAPESSCLC